MRMTTKLRELLAAPGLVLGGGAHDGLSRENRRAGGLSRCAWSPAPGASMCRGYPDIGLVTMPEMVENARYIAEAVRIPVIVDADNGYGNAINARRTVREFERAGVAGIHIEDQVWPKRCGHMFGKRLIAKDEMVGKLKAALDARRDPDFVIIARCDAIMVNGLRRTRSIAARRTWRPAPTCCSSRCASRWTRCARWPSASAGACRCTSTTRRAAWCRGCTSREIEALGFKTACFYVHALMAACKVMREVLTEIKETGNSLTVWDRMVKFDEFWEIAGLADYRQLEKKYGA